MNFANARYSFEGPRIDLRIMDSSNATQQYADWINDPEVNQYLATKGTTLDELTAYIADRDKQEDALFFGIFTKDEKHIGTIKLEPIELEKKKATIAIMIGDKNYWGKGMAGEAMEILINWCFNELDCTSVNLGVIAQNEAAIRTYEKIGFTETKREHNYVTYGDELCDQVWMERRRLN